MERILKACVLFCFGCLLVPTAGFAGKGYMGGTGTVTASGGGGGGAQDEPVVVEEEPNDTGGLPADVEGPLNDKMADSGKLYGDLYVILRQQGVVGDKKLVPAVNTAGEPVLTDGVQLFVSVENTADAPDNIIGGEPVLTVIDPSDDNSFADYGWYAADTDDDGVGDTATQSPYPAQCVQPVASYERWGDISSKTLLTKNRIPMVITYDATWYRSECAVGQLTAIPSVKADGTLNLDEEGVVNPYFVEPCLDEDGTTIADADCTWEDPNNGMVTYPYGVLWTDLIGEVHFGRLNIGRSPEAVMQAAFDEAINNLNSPDTIAIEIDAAGRLLLTKNVYDDLLVYKLGDKLPNGDLVPQELLGTPKWIATVKKAIDSPLENVALYHKLMTDGHLVTSGDERAPIDRSKNGGIPIWKMLELEDGPGAAALRPTIDIAKLVSWGLGSLVNVSEEDYLTYYVCLNDAGGEVPCLIWDEDPVQPEIDRELVGNPAAVSRDLKTVLESEGCPDSGDVDNPYDCEGPFTGITTDDGGAPDTTDLNFTAAFLAAAADKTGDIGVDMVVYLNSILGINKVLGYSEYDADGNPTADAINYEESPVYFNFRGVSAYSREDGTFDVRGQVDSIGGPEGNGGASTYDGFVTVLQETLGSWNETPVTILKAQMSDATIFDNIDLGVNAFPNGLQAKDNILGFTQQADDDLSVIKFIHTYQIPGLR